MWLKVRDKQVVLCDPTGKEIEDYGGLADELEALKAAKRELEEQLRRQRGAAANGGSSRRKS